MFALSTAVYLTLAYLNSRGLFAYPVNAWYVTAVFCVLAILFLYSVCAGVASVPAFVTAVAGAGYHIYLSHVLPILVIEYSLPPMALLPKMWLRIAAALVLPVGLGVLYNHLKEGRKTNGTAG